MQRIDFSYGHEGVQSLVELDKHLALEGLEASLLTLVRLYASMLNGCGHGTKLNTQMIRLSGESDFRIENLTVWKTASCYSARERAALAWTESLTLLRKSDVPDRIYNQLTEEFSQEEILNLTLAVCAINSWNRLNIGLRKEPDTPEQLLESVKE